MNAAAPKITSLGPPPERHAARMVAEMCGWLVGERERRNARMRAAMARSNSHLGNPVAQRRFFDRYCEAGGPALLDVKLDTGKRGKFKVMITDWAVWNPASEHYVKPGEAPPPKPWLEAASSILHHDPRRPGEWETYRIFVVTHHAMQRLAERCGARTPADLILAMRELFDLLFERYLAGEREVPCFLRLPAAGGVAVMERAEGGEMVVKTFLDPGMAGDEEVER